MTNLKKTNMYRLFTKKIKLKQSIGIPRVDRQKMQKYPKSDF